MGKPTHAVIVYDDGTERVLSGSEMTIAGDGHGQIQLLYDYHQSLFPSEEWSNDGMWRYRSLLPVEEGPITYPLPVGGSPLIAPPQLRHQLRLPHVWLKDETRGPSGSNKDRATALVLQHAMATGARRVTCASTGNVAVSLAVGAAAAGKEAITFVPADVADSKLIYMLQAGATVIRVQEGYEAAFRLSQEAAKAFGWIDRNTGVNPMTVEAKKTVAFEIWEQLGHQIPDVVVVPVGDGPTLNGIAKGFRELVECGVAPRTPRLLGVQAEGCQPIKRSWETGEPLRPTDPKTIADGIAVGVPVAGAKAIHNVVESGGSFLSVTDQQMLEAMGMLATSGGLLAEPSGAAGYAGLAVAGDLGLVGLNERVVVLVTGSALKTPQYIRPVGRAFDIEATLDELRQVMAAAGID